MTSFRGMTRLLTSVSVLCLTTMSAQCLTSAATTPPPCTPPPPAPRQAFTVVWNIPTMRCHGYLHDVLTKWGIVDNTANRWFGDKMNLFYLPSNFGAFPYYANRDKNRPVNGGLPQLANMTSHLAKVKADIDRIIPDVTFSGLAVIDHELWRPYYYTNYGALSVYKWMSVELEKKRNPGGKWNDWERKAVTEFNNAARQFLEKTLDYAKELRPRARWGFYGYPRCWGKCSGGDTVDINNRLASIWRKSTGIYPSIYYSSGVGTFHLLREAIRVRDTYAPRDTPIFAYTSVYGNFGKKKLDEQIGAPAEIGIDGVVLWGPSSLTRRRSCSYFRDSIENTLGPYVRDLTSRFSRCAELVCHGRGRCVRKEYETNYTPHHTNTQQPVCDGTDGETPLTMAASGDAEKYQLEDFAKYSCRCIDGWKGRQCDLSP